MIERRRQIEENDFVPLAGLVRREDPQLNAIRQGAEALWNSQLPPETAALQPVDKHEPFSIVDLSKFYYARLQGSLSLAIRKVGLTPINFHDYEESVERMADLPDGFVTRWGDPEVNGKPVAGKLMLQGINFTIGPKPYKVQGKIEDAKIHNYYLNVVDYVAPPQKPQDPPESVAKLGDLQVKFENGTIKQVKLAWQGSSVESLECSFGERAKELKEELEKYDLNRGLIKEKGRYEIVVNLGSDYPKDAFVEFRYKYGFTQSVSGEGSKSAATLRTLFKNVDPKTFKVYKGKGFLGYIKRLGNTREYANGIVLKGATDVEEIKEENVRKLLELVLFLIP